MSGDKRKAFEAILKKLEKLFPHLGNENDGEALNAVRSITALLKKNGLDWHDLVALMHGTGQPLFEMLSKLQEKEADTLVRLARTAATLFVSAKRVAFADVRVGDRVLTLPLRSTEFSEWLLAHYYKEKQRAPKLSAEKDAIRTLTSVAKYENPERCEVHLRSAQVGKTLIVDIGDETGQAIEITASGWRVLPAPPVKFQRMAGMEALPIPERSGNIQELRRFTNLSDADFILLVTVLADALCPDRPHVLLNLIGEAGSGKTTAERIVRSLVDPNEVPAGTLPREARDLFVDVNNSHVLAYDNVGAIPKSVSDSLCQITSGTGFRKRKNYTDLEAVRVSGFRTVVLTAVYNAVTEPDLAERCVTMTLSQIDSGERRSEAQLWQEFERARPRIFGALLDIVAHGLRLLPNIHVPDLPRLADFALLGVAIEGAFAPVGAFLAAFTASQAVATDATIETNPVAAAIAGFMEGKVCWHGTSTQFWRELQARDPTEARATETRNWPKDPVSFGIALSKAIPTLRKIRIEVIRDRSKSRQRTPMIHVRHLEQAEQRHAAGTAEGSERSEGLPSSRGLAKIVQLK
jgi:hypothetical protein